MPDDFILFKGRHLPAVVNFMGGDQHTPTQRRGLDINKLILYCLYNVFRIFGERKFQVYQNIYILRPVVKMFDLFCHKSIVISSVYYIMVILREELGIP